MAKEIRFYDDDGTLYPRAMLNGIDTNNVIASNLQTYTATEDCIALCYRSAYVDESITWYLDGIEVCGTNYSANMNLREWHIVYIKKGQTIASPHTHARISIYGIKH